MSTVVNRKGQITIPKPIQDALGLKPGNVVKFTMRRDGEVILSKAAPRPARKPDRFEQARGKAHMRWRTDSLMALLRSDQT